MSLSHPYTFKINNTDYSSKVQKYSYETSYTPVYSEAVTTMDKVDHTVIVRWKHGLTVTIMPSSETDLHNLQTALSSSNIPSIKFSSLQLGNDVTCNMVATPESVSLALKNASRRVLSAMTLTFTEM